MLVDRVVPPTYANVFSYGTFNSMQSKLVHQAFESDENMVIAAPTGSGKTVIHELAICRLHLLKGAAMKAVYVAPSKALCQQRWTEWDQKFSSFGLRVLEVTGDIDLKDCLRLVAKASIIITTPEKWDSLTRVWRDHIYLLTATDLLLLDEIHHLGEDRGPTLETVVVRMRVLAKVREEQMKANPTLSFDMNQQSPMRIIALSATLPNINDIGEWLSCKPNAVHSFDDTFRPVTLNVHTLSYGSAHSPFLFERALDARVPDLIKRFSNNRQTLIFCSSKKGAENLAMILLKDPSLRRDLPSSSLPLINDMRDETLKGIIQRGIAYHHAGLPPDDRAIVERLFLAGNVKILCSTSTLAHGVNLPAHLVIVKGTLSWRGSGKGYERLRRSDVIQMLGRAGRPGFDEFGTALIMTSEEDKSFYAQVTTSADLVISSLPTMLHEAFVSEISQRVITSFDDCLRWFKSTFFYTCLKKGRLHDVKNEIHDEEELEEYISQLAFKVMHDLRTGGLITFTQDTNDNLITPLQEAHIMCRFLTRFKSMLTLMQISPHVKISTLLKEISLCEELHKPVRKAEKKILNDCMSSIRFPSKERVQTSSQKCQVLMQAAVARVELKEFALKIEQAEIIDMSLRLLHCLQDLALYHARGMLLETVLLLSRALDVRLWETSDQNIFLQCRDLPVDVLTSIQSSGKCHPLLVFGMTFNQVLSEFHCSAREASVIMTFAREFAHSKLQVTPSLESGSGKLTLTITPAIEVEGERRGSDVIQYHLVCYLTDTAKLICHRKLPKQTMHTVVTLDWHESEGEFVKLRCCLIANIAGLDSYAGAPPSSATDTTEAAVVKRATTKAKNKDGSNDKGNNNSGSNQRIISAALPGASSVLPAVAVAVAVAAVTTATAAAVPTDHSNNVSNAGEEKVNQEEMFQGSVQGKVSRSNNPPPRAQQQQKENHPPNPFSQYSFPSSQLSQASQGNSQVAVVPSQLQKIRKQAYDTNITDIASVKRLKSSASTDYGQGGGHYSTPADLLQRQAMNSEVNMANMASSQQRGGVLGGPQKFFESPLQAHQQMQQLQERNDEQQQSNKSGGEFFDFKPFTFPSSSQAPHPHVSTVSNGSNKPSAGTAGSAYSLFVPTGSSSQPSHQEKEEVKEKPKPFRFLAAKMQKIPSSSQQPSLPSTAMDEDFDDAFM